MVNRAYFNHESQIPKIEVTQKKQSNDVKSFGFVEYKIKKEILFYLIIN